MVGWSNRHLLLPRSLLIDHAAHHIKHCSQKTFWRNLRRQVLHNPLILCCFWQCLSEVFLFQPINCIVTYKHIFKEHLVSAKDTRQLSMLTCCSTGGLNGERLQKYWAAFNGEALKVFCVCPNTEGNYNQNTFQNWHWVYYLEKHLSSKSKWFLYYFKL